MSKYYCDISEIEHLIVWPDHKMPLKEFISHCPNCGGNWATMFIQGLETCFPYLYKSLPDDGTFDGMLLLRIVSRVTTQD